MTRTLNHITHPSTLQTALMKGYVLPQDSALEPDDDSTLPFWQELVVHAVGTVIEFWGFKRNQGRVWGLLYLRDEAMTAAQVRQELALSKGAVSMILRELESWGVIHRTRRPGTQSWSFVAEVDLFKMIGHVFRAREVMVVQRVRQDLVEAERLALMSDNVPQTVLTRIARMRQLATFIEHALSVFLKTARLDMTQALGIFDPDDDAYIDGAQDPTNKRHH